MKIIYSFLTLILLSSVAFAQITLPIDFESTTINYELGDFADNQSTIVPDPEDPTNTVVQSIKLATALDYAGTVAGDNGLASPIPFSANDKTMSVRVWSPDAGITVKLKVEDAANAAIIAEVDALTTMAGAWETLTFDFNNPVNGGIDLNNTYDKVVIFFNFGVTGAAAGEKTYYWDDVQFVLGPPAQVDLPITFEGTNVLYNLFDFNGNGSTIVTDPTDPNNTVVETTKSNTALESAGTIAGDAGLANPIPFSTIDKKMSVRVWSPDAGIVVKLKVEDATNGSIFAEVDMNTTVASQWETLEFDFENVTNGTLDLANTYDKVVIFFNFGTDGATAGEKTYYWDDVQFIATPPVALDLPITFDDPTVAYSLIDFEGNGPSSVVVDPTDPNNTVAQVIKTIEGGTSAGVTVGGLGLVNPIGFSNGNTTMTVRVWSPTAGTPIRLKVEKVNDPTISVETEATTTVAMEWETLEFDFSNEATGTAEINFANIYNMVSIFFNFGTSGAAAGEQTYYFDDVFFEGGPALDQIDLPVTFEEATVDYTLIDFGEAVSQIVTDPTNPANTVIETLKPDNAASWAGTVIGTDDGFANAIPFTAEDTKMTVRVWSPAAGMPVMLKIETVANADIFVETVTNTTVAMEWETIEFDFATPLPTSPVLDLNEVYGKAIIFFNFDIDGATAGALTFFWDDVEFIAGPSLDQIDLPVTFEDATVDYTLIDFGEAVSQMVVDPTSATNTVIETLKPDNAASWAGTVIGTDDGFANAIPFSATETKMNVRVWSPAAGTPVLLKVETVANADIYVETLSSTTVAMEWETLEFDFSNPTATSPVLDFNEVYGKAIIFFNFDIDGATAGNLTFYWDDVNFGGIPIAVDNVAKANIKVSPNPAGDFVNIEFPEALVDGTTATLLDVSGKVMLQQNMNNVTNQINTAGFSAGTYFLRIDTNENSYYQKVMIVR